MPRLHLICGLPCSGKTTLAKQLETEIPALRFSPDEWMARIVGDGFDEARRKAVEATQWQIAVRAVGLGINVVLENGFWTRSERDLLQSKAKTLSVRIKLHYLNVPREELLRRIAVRNAAAPPDTFPITEAQLDAWSRLFDTPTADELV